MTRVLHVFTWALLALSLCQCTSGKPHLTEQAIREQIVGTWTEEIKKRGRVLTGEKTFCADGTAHGWCDMTIHRGNTTFHEGRMSYRDRWRVVGDVIETYDIWCSDPGVFPPGTVLHDRVLEITPAMARFIDLDKRPRRYIMQRSVSTKQ